MFEIDKYSRVPIYEQVIRQLELMILSGELAPNDQAPSVRTLSLSLSVNPNTLQRAYMELERRGICYSVPGNGRFISRDAQKILKETGGERMAGLIKLLKDMKATGVLREEVMRVVDSVYDAD